MSITPNVIRVLLCSRPCRAFASSLAIFSPISFAIIQILAFLFGHSIKRNLCVGWIWDKGVALIYSTIVETYRNLLEKHFQVLWHVTDELLLHSLANHGVLEMEWLGCMLKILHCLTEHTNLSG